MMSQLAKGKGSGYGVTSSLFTPALPNFLRPAHSREDSTGTQPSETGHHVDNGNHSDETDDELEWMDPYYFIKTLPPRDTCAPPRQDFVLPRRTRQSKKHTLVLDLDETLIHSELGSTNGIPHPYHFSFQVELGGQRHSFYVWRRPGLDRFLDYVCDQFEVVIFTASQKVYADRVLNVLDPLRRIRHRIFREDCTLVEGNYLKDLTVLGRDLARTMIVDNSPQAFGFQVENGIPIDSWFGEPDDDALMALVPVLDRCGQVEDVREFLVNHYQLHKLIAEARE